MSETSHKNQRRNYFIDRKFQAMFITKFCSIIILSSAVIGVIVFLLARSSTTVAIENTEITIKATSDFILPLLIVTVLSVALCASAIVMVMTVFISHSIAGPAYRLKKEVDLLRQGNLNRSYKLRRNDQLLELADSLDYMTKILKEKHLGAKEKADALHHDFELIEMDRNSERVKLFQQHLRDLKSNLDYFKPS